MAFQNAAPARRNKNELVVGIGSRAYVNWSPPAGQARSGVPILDGAGKLLSNDLSDGQEVEIVSWRPRSREGLSYQVRRVSDGAEWWIAATYLRRLAVASPVALVVDKARG
ncbi:MAG: hypothetical protein ABI629_01555 [bacterium]